MNPRERTVPDYFGFHQARYRPQRRLGRSWLDAAPLVDMALILLLFFMLSSSFVLQPGITLDLPVAPFDSGTPYGTLVVTLSREGLVFFNDERGTLDGLRGAFASAAQEDPEARLLIEADGSVPHERLVRVYNLAVAAGIRKVTLATRLPGMGERP